MKRYSFFNAQRVNVEDMNFINMNSNENIREAIGLHLTSGIIRAAESLTLGELQKKIQFPTFTQNASDTGKLDILLTAGYIIVGLNKKGYPVIIQANETWQTADPNKSSGNYAIPFSGDGTYYIWMDYYETTDTSVSRTNKYAIPFNPLKDDGYIIVVDTAGPTIPPSSNPDAIYLGEVVVAGGIVDPGQFDQTTSIAFAGIKPQNIFVEIDESNKTPVYEDGKTVGLDEHINAIGEYPVSPDNPHGIHPNDIKAIDAIKFSQNGPSSSDKINLMKNGLLSLNDQDQKISSSPTPEIINVPPTQWYVELPAPLTGWNFVYNGRVYSYDAGELHNVDSVDNKVKVYFTPGSDAEGWYLIYADIANPGDEFLTLQKTFYAGVPFYNNESETRILFGWVFWKNTSPTIQLQTNERNTSPINGTKIFPTPSLGSFNDERFTNANVKRYSTQVGKNIFPNGGFKYGAPIINGKINGVMTITGANYSVYSTPFGSFQKRLKVDNITSGATIVITIPANINIDSNTIFNFSCSATQQLPGGGYMRLSVSGMNYDIPDYQSTEQKILADWIGSSVITITFFNTTTDSSNYVVFDNFQILKTKNYQPNNLVDDTVTGDIFHDASSVPEKRTEITTIPLNQTIMRYLGIYTSLKQFSAGTGTADHAFNYDGWWTGKGMDINPATDFNNIEIMLVQGQIDYNASDNRYTGYYHFPEWNVTHKLIGCIFFAMEPNSIGTDYISLFSRLDPTPKKIYVAATKAGDFSAEDCRIFGIVFWKRL